MKSLLVGLSIVTISCGAKSAPAPVAPPAPAPAAAATPKPGPVPEETAEDRAEHELGNRLKQLDGVLDAEWQDRLQRHPELASIIGDHRYDDRWTDHSADAIAAELAADKQFLDQLKAIDTTGFAPQRALDQQLLVRQLQEELDDAKFEDWLMPINQMSGVHLRMPQLVSLLRFDTALDYEHYLARLHGVPKVLDQTTALMKDGVTKQLVPPRILLVECVKQTRAIAAGKPEASPFAQPVMKFPDSIPKADQDRLRAAILDAIQNEVQPAYTRFADYLEKDYVPHGRAEPGVWSLPDGDARYAADVKRTTTTDLTPDQIHQIGLDEVARIEKEETALLPKLGFKTLADLRKHVRGDKKLYATSRAQILSLYEKYEAQMEDKLPSLFGRLPKQKLQVKEVESFREKAAAGAEYQKGTPDGSRIGTIRVNTSDPTKRLTINMESTAYHEGVPGHHLQIAIQQELGGLAPFRQQGGYTAFVEGWALYAERLGEEVGFYQDPWSMYGHLEDEMLRAIRLVVDTGVHAKHWKREQMVAFFHAHSAVSEVEVQAETNRYIAWPGQALGYKIGQLTISRLRKEAEDQLGPKFDLRAFHDEVLGSGALPLDVLEARIHAWIDRQKAVQPKP